MSRKEVIQIRCSAAEKDKWTTAARDVHMELSPWIRHQLDLASRPGSSPIRELFPVADLDE